VRHAGRLKAVVSYLRSQWARTHVIIVGILPRGGWTMPEDPSAWPNRFTEPIAIVNNASQARCCQLQLPLEAMPGEYSNTQIIRCSGACL
jgi:hypothetical protein